VTDTNVFHMARHPRLLQQNRHKADISRLSSNVRFWGFGAHLLTLQEFSTLPPWLPPRLPPGRIVAPAAFQRRN
jgi:hypothetical protein